MAIKLKEALEAVDGTRGNVTKIADKLGCRREHIYRLRSKWSTFDDAIIEEKERFKDVIETTMEDEILAGNTTLLIFYAKTQMKDRGFVERQEQHVTGEIKTPVQFVDVIRPGTDE